MDTAKVIAGWRRTSEDERDFFFIRNKKNHRYIKFIYGAQSIHNLNYCLKEIVFYAKPDRLLNAIDMNISWYCGYASLINIIRRENEYIRDSDSE